MTSLSSAARPSRRRALCAFVSLAIAALGVTEAPAVPLGSPVYQDCTQALLKTSSSLLKKRTQALTKCTNALLECQLQNELGTPDPECATAAVVSCNKGLDKLASGEESAAGKLAKSCEPLRDYDFAISTGIAYRRNEDRCGAITTEAEAYDCLFSRVRCRAADIVESIHPRSYELLEEAGLVASRPDDTGCFDVRADHAPMAGDPIAIGECQAALAKTLLKPFVNIPKDFSSCIGTLLECRLHADRLAINLPQPPTCYSGKTPDSACAKAEKKLTAAQSVELAFDALEVCSAVSLADLKDALGFDENCGSELTVVDVIDCARDLAEESTLALNDEVAPRSCQLSEESGQSVFNVGDFCASRCGDGRIDDEENCDDGNRFPYDSCSNDCELGPTYIIVAGGPATATPAHTPDGTPGNAVAPGSSVAIQFGTTSPNLNNVGYVRYLATGAGDPDAVLVLVPGFAGGAHSLKILAETMVAKAAADGDIVLEVWTFDRRTDQLEDDFGGELADDENDPMLAMDWYFGADLGLTLDPELPRRAVFHDGSDIPFIANFTYNMFIHDIDDVIDAAHALPSSPKVFLGGHSLGTLFSARYAATDLDIGPGLEAGHDKVAGLVLFEGGGDSLPTGPPSSDALDTVIAKHDGGLYHAIKNGVASCYDGTPCPGGHGDCSAIALAPGAVTNKCVQPTDAYAGGVISPEIHAVGDAVSIQARLTPDSLSIAQVDFGSGAAVNEVPGLSLLSALPLSSAEASVGFFLDDDYSPEVSFQSSMGLSVNGGHLDLGTFLLAQAATNDPYRYWSGIEAAMPPLAVPDNGDPADAFAVNGQEKEISPMTNVLTMVRTGDRNIGDWYFPAAGLGVTAELIVGVGGFTGGLDSTALSVGRGRPDIENLTQGANIDIPVISFGGSNGISPTLGAMLPFAESIATCTAPSCDGTARIVSSDPINPVYGGADGGFEVYVSEGYAHIDVVSAEDDPSHNEVYDPLLDFLERNTP